MRAGILTGFKGHIAAVLALGLTLATISALAAQARSVAEALPGYVERGLAAPASEQEATVLAAVARYYAARGNAPIWVSDSGPNGQAEAVAGLLAEADLDGLNPEDYGVGAILPLLTATGGDELAELELRLSAGLAQFAADLGQGRTEPHIADPKLYLFRDRVDPAQVIGGAAEAPDIAAYLEGYRPQNPRYARLKQTLSDYRALAARGGWAPVPEGPALKPGMRDARVPLLRARLRLWGDLPEGAEPGQGMAQQVTAGEDPAHLYDDALVQAIERMQRRHGLDPDGVVGPATLRALNVTAEERVTQIVLNLERRRWMPDDMGQRFIFVNLADFALKLVDEPKTLLDMAVVVGKPYHMTPQFSGTMTYLEVNPYWNVPPSIARKEILPKLRKDASYLERNKFTLFSDWSSSAKVVDPATVDWALAADKGFPFKVRQEPGDHNALGRIKFMFPNRFSIYLHDTPAKSLFKKPTRSFSHGCIRVSDPVRLAETVLAGTQGWPRDRIESAIQSGNRQVVPLAVPLPVHIGYLTAYTNKDGTVHFRGDVYGRDERLAQALLGRGVPAGAN